MSFSQAQRDIVNKAMEAGGIPGVAAAIVKDGEIVAAEGFGYRDLENKLPMTPRTVSPICSLTKSMTGTAVMQLVEAGKLSLDEPVQSYIPSLRIADEATTRKITPRILLSHKSGMGRTGHQRVFLDGGEGPYKDRGDLVSRLGDIKMQTPPNIAWSYCNEGFVTLGFLVETVSGIPLEEYFERRIFQAVGMSDTVTSFAKWRSADNRSHQYNHDGGGFKETRLPQNYSVYLSTGGICSTAHDLARYQIASMDYENSPLLTAGSLDQMQTISMPFGDSGTGYGLGWSIRWHGSRKIVSHGGGLPGVSTHSLTIPSEKIGVVVLTNLGGAKVAQLAARLAETVLGESLYPPESENNQPFRTRYVTPENILPQFAGKYEADAMKIEVMAEDGRLAAVVSSGNPGESETMFMQGVGDNLFLGWFDPERPDSTPVYFVRGDNGVVTSLLMGGSQLWRA
jgi:CubicO group peptidase (beta-lactamase class C family)